MPLQKYREKRNPERTPEPFGSRDPAAITSRNGGMFVIQKHAARRLHYDFRLAMEGVLRSWAVPKGPSLDPKQKHLAVMVEDHPLDYGDFEGVIPRDNYGAGEVIVWDRGVYKVIDPPEGDPAECVRRGKLDIEMRGFKLRGAFTLVRTGMKGSGKSDKENWLLIKKRDQYASADDFLANHPRSVLSGLTIEEMRDASAIGLQVSSALAKTGAHRFADPLRPKDFPLNLARPSDEVVDGESWLFEIKYDGVRALAVRDGEHVRIFARSGVDVTERYPEAALAFDAMPFDRFVMDGEIVNLREDGRPDFQMLQRRMHVQDAATARRLSLSIPVVDFVFDLLAFDGYDLRRSPLEQRKEILHRLIRGEGPIRYCDHVVGKGREFYDAMCRLGLEGMIAKRRDSVYRGARTPDWLKIKCPKVRNFVVGGWTEPERSRAHFGALLLGVYEDSGALRYVGKVGTGFSGDTLKSIHDRLKPLERQPSPFRPPSANERAVERKVHFAEPKLAARVRFADLTEEGCLRHPSFLGIADEVDPRECTWEQAFADSGSTSPDTEQIAMPRESAASTPNDKAAAPAVTVTNPEKVFWPREGYTKGDLVGYYRAIAPWMLPYLKDRPVMIVRYPDGIEGKSFYQKDAPEFAPEWLRTESIYSEDSRREINYFVIESADALAYLANLATIPIHIWSSRVGSLENPDWLLFDIDPKGSTTEMAVEVARATVEVLGEIGLRAVVKTSGQMGLHVVVGLKPVYTYQQARDFSELVSGLVVSRVPRFATVERNKDLRKGKVYIDYLQLGYGKTIAGPYAVRPNPGAPVSSPLRVGELKPALDPGAFTIRNMAQRMAKLKKDPFLGAIEDKQTLDQALEPLTMKYKEAGLA